MIKFRLASFEKTSKDQDINIIEGEKLSEAVKRIIETTEIKEDPKEAFKVVVNGHIIVPDLWDFTKLKETDNVLIAPNLQGGEGGFGQLLAIVAIALVAPYTAPMIAAEGLSAIGGGLINAGVAFLASYAASQLFPPPVVGSGLVGAGNLPESQMYSISSQANSLKKFGRVPKVYGEHRMFPTVAANPYTELEVDPATGKLVQVFYAIYDFGLGINEISDIRIGNTPLDNFSDVAVRLVDPNKPSVNEGSWDDATSKQFELYKGDVFSEQVGVAINGNQENNDPQSEYLVTRTAGSNPDNLSQEITLNFVCPSGLFAFDSGGNRGNRTIELDIRFSRVGENNWIEYNNPIYVARSSSIGGDSNTANKPLTLAQFNPALPDPDNLNFPYSIFSTTPYTVKTMRYGLTAQTTRKIVIGLAYNRPLYVNNPHNLIVGDRIITKYNQVIGIVSSITSLGSYSQVNLTNRVQQNIPLFEYTEVKDEVGFDEFIFGQRVYTPLGDVSLNTKIYKAGDPLGTLSITASTQEQHFSAVKFTPKAAGNYEVRVTRIRSRSNNNTSIQDDLSWGNINTRTDTQPILTTKRHTFLEIKIKASGQLNGAIQNLSAKCKSVLDVWNGSAWVKQATNNPAWVFVDLLTGEVNKRAISKNRLDIASIYEWAQFCEEIPNSPASYTYYEQRFQCNFILDFETTLQQILGQVSGAAQASLNIVDGKYGVLLDIQKTVPVQIFTPRNSSGFSSNRAYPQRPHALRVSYVDPNSDWQPNELIVYADGYNELTATIFEDIQTFACTQVEQAFRFGRYFLAQGILRQETITLRVDFEHLVCTRGDYVQITQDSMKVGGTPARVKSRTGNQIVIDEGIETNINLDYGYVFRDSATGQIYTNTLTVVSADTFDLDGTPLPNPGDLIIIGEIDFIVFDCLVKAISPADDMSAILTLVEKADPLYTIEEVDTIPGYDPRLSQTVNPDFAPPPEVNNLQVTANSYEVKNAGYQHFVSLDWDAPTGAAYEFFEVHVDWGKGYELVNTTKFSDYKFIVDNINLGTAHNFKILAVSSTGKKLSLGEVGFVSATPVRKTSPPSSVELFNSDITGETLQLFWTLVEDLDIKEYVIRFVPELNGAWQDSTTVLRVSPTTSLAATQARTGTYLIKAVDLNGNESLEAAAIITTIPSLNGLNVIEEISDFPALTGSKDRVETFGTSLILQQSNPGSLGNEVYYSEGYYYYNDLLNLSEIYQVRLQALIKAQGYVATDIMSNWATLSDVDLLYSPGSSDWDVELQYRSTNALNVMEDWASMSSVLTLSGGSEDIWTPWRKFIIGDATGRIFQFRLKLISYKPNVSPRVLEAIIRADMPDRVESFNNVLATISGAVVTYSPAFKNIPNVQITLENGQSGDYWEFVSKTEEGFEIVFKNNLGNPVARQFDAVVKGYGRKAANVL